MGECNTCTGCNGCNKAKHKRHKTPEAIPYVAYEALKERHNRRFKLMIIAIIVAFAVVFSSNLIWICVMMNNTSGKNIDANASCTEDISKEYANRGGDINMEMIDYIQNNHDLILSKEDLLNKVYDY